MRLGAPKKWWKTVWNWRKCLYHMFDWAKAWVLKYVEIDVYWRSCTDVPRGYIFLQQMPFSIKEVFGNNQVRSKFLMLKQSQSLASNCTQEPNVVRECLYLPQKLEKLYTDLIRCIAHWTMWYSFIAFFQKNNYLLLPKIDRHFYLIFLHVANLQLTRTTCLRSA